MIKNAYYRGFAQKCAELGVDPRKLLKLASMQKKAEGEMSVEEMYPWGSEFAKAENDGITPEEFSASSFGLHALHNSSSARNGVNSLDNIGDSTSYEWLRDPRFMSDAGITPAGTNLLESIKPDFPKTNEVPWDVVDRVTGIGRGYKGRNIPLPEGFLHKSAPTNSTLNAVAPEIFAQPKK